MGFWGEDREKVRIGPKSLGRGRRRATGRGGQGQKSGESCRKVCASRGGNIQKKLQEGEDRVEEGCAGYVQKWVFLFDLAAPQKVDRFIGVNGGVQGGGPRGPFPGGGWGGEEGGVIVGVIEQPEESHSGGGGSGGVGFM